MAGESEIGLADFMERMDERFDRVDERFDRVDLDIIELKGRMDRAESRTTGDPSA